MSDGVRHASASLHRHAALVAWTPDASYELARWRRRRRTRYGSHHGRLRIQLKELP